MGVSPIQSKDFWISEEAKRFWDKDQFTRIDAELIRLEGISEGYIFDTSTMPWRHKRPALSIWLESDLESRILKSIISHRGRGRFTHSEYRDRIIEKDNATLMLYRELYGIDIGQDRSCFDLVIDISALIQAPTLVASLESISTAHAIIRPAVCWYLTRQSRFEREFKDAIDVYSQYITLNRLLK